MFMTLHDTGSELWNTADVTKCKLQRDLENRRSRVSPLSIVMVVAISHRGKV